MMLLLEALEEMRKNQEPKKEFFHLEHPLINGILKINVQNFGLYIILELIRVKVPEFFHYQIGQS